MKKLVRRRRRTLILAALAVLLAIGGTPAALGCLTTYALLYSPCSEAATTPGDFGLAYEDLTISARAGGRFRAFFIPPSDTAGAVIVIPPTTAGGRGTRLDKVDMFARHGYGVVTFESRRCAGMGPLSLGYKETSEVGDVLAYLKTRPDVGRIGIYGFSSAGAASVMAAAKYPEIAAVIAEGGYGDFAEGAVGIGTNGDSVLESIYRRSVGVSYRAITGVNISRLSPIDVIGQIAPRPILLIYGSYEPSLAGAYKQLAAAGDNADLWVVEGATHGAYFKVAPEEYERRVIAFFDAALLGGN